VINFSPPKVDKNFAVEFLLKRHPEITSQNILVAGDDVVDIPLFKEGRTIFVPSQQKEVLEQVNQLKCSKVYKISSPGQEHGRWLIDTLKEHLKKVLGAE
jgi:hydroxymethylpyrimidine pyrophosphatase-like HAD family hydrolase